MEETSSMSKEEDSKSEIGMEDYTEISDVDDDIQIGINEDINQDEIQEEDEMEVEKEEILPKFDEAKLRELLRNLKSVEVKIYSEAAKEFIKLLRGDTGGEILRHYVQASPLCIELEETWNARKGKSEVSKIISLITAVLEHPDGKFISGDKERLIISQKLDKFARLIIKSESSLKEEKDGLLKEKKSKLPDVYEELKSKEGRRQNAALLLMTAIVKRGVGLASEVAEHFDFKLPVFASLAEYKKNKVENRKHSTRKSFIKFALSFLEVGNPRLLRWVLQQKEMFSGILRGLGSDDEETVVYVLSTLRDRVLTLDSLVPPSLRSVLFGSVTLEQLSSISGNPVDGPSADVAHEVLVMVCTDPQNGLMPNQKGVTNPLKGNRKRLLDLMKKLNAKDNGYHKDLLLEIVNGRPSFGSAYMDEFAAVSLVSDLISSTSTSFSFGAPASQIHDPPTLDSPEVQCMLKCIIPRAFSRGVINRGLQHEDLYVKHGSVKLLLEALKSLENLVGSIDYNSRSNNSMVHKWLNLKQDIQDEARAVLPDPQVLFKLLSDEKKEKDQKNDPKRCNKKMKRSTNFECHAGAKKSKIDRIDGDIDILIGGISSEPDNAMLCKTESIMDELIIDQVENKKESADVIAGIWGLQRVEQQDAEICFHSKVLDVLALYLRTMPNTLEGSYDFFKELPSDPFTLSSNQQQSLLPLLIEYIGWSPERKVPNRPPEALYKHLHPLVNLLIRSPIKEIQNQAYTLARAAMFSTGAFDRDIQEIDAWFLFLPGYRREGQTEEGQGHDLFGDLFGVVVSFFCDAVSTVGNNLYKYHDMVRCKLSELNDIKDAPDFSPLVFCILDKCLRLCDLSRRNGFGDFTSLDDSSNFPCEWRPLKNLLLLSQNVSKKQACCSSYSIPQRTQSASRHPFARTLDNIKEIIKSGQGGDLVGVAAGFSSSIICISSYEILENFPSIITISHLLLGKHLQFLSYPFFLEQNFLSRVSDLWANIVFSALEHFDTIAQNSRCSSYSSEEIISSMEVDSIKSASVAFSFFLKEAPFYVLFSSVLRVGNLESFVSSKLVDILKVKLTEGSPDDLIASLRLALFWAHQIQLSFRVDPVDELERPLQICFICIKHILTQLFAVKSNFDTLSISEFPVLVPYLQEVARIVFHHPAVILSLLQPLCRGLMPACVSLGNGSEDFVSSLKFSVHSMEHNILELLTTVANYFFSSYLDQVAVTEVQDAENKKLLKIFKSLVRQVILFFMDKFDCCIRDKDLTPILPAYHIVVALSPYISPIELLELVQWIFRKVDLIDSIGWKSFKIDAFAMGCYIFDAAFDLLSSYLHQVSRRKVHSSLLWEVKGGNVDISLLQETYYKVIELATTSKLRFADICLLKAVNTVYKQKTMLPKEDLFPLVMALSRVIKSTPIEIISHCIYTTSATKAKLLFLLTEVSPLHLTLFGQVFLSILGKNLPSTSNMIEENHKCVIADDDLILLLPVALSYLNLSITKFGVQYLKSLGAITSIYSRILLDGFLNWRSFASRTVFQEEFDESPPSSTKDLLNVFGGTLYGKTIHMLRYCFALNADSIDKKKRKDLFCSMYSSSGTDAGLLDCDVGEINNCSIDDSLNIAIRAIAKVCFSRLLLFPADNFIQSLRTKRGGELKEMTLEVGSTRKDSMRLRLMRILVSTLRSIAMKFPVVTDNSGKSKRPECSVFTFLETYILRNISELCRKMQTELVQFDSLPFLDTFFSSSLRYRFEDPITLKVLKDVVITLSEGKFSSGVLLELMQAHSHFIPSILWTNSISDSSSVFHGVTLLRPLSSILKSHVLLLTDLHMSDDKINLDLSSSHSRKLEVIKLLRVLYHLKACQNGNVAPAEDISMVPRELLSLLLSCYGATMGKVDLEIFSLMSDIVSAEGSDLSINEMDYLWGGAALKLRRVKELESTHEIINGETCEERRRRQFRESFSIDQNLCVATVLHFPNERVDLDSLTTTSKLQEDNLLNMLEEPYPRIDKIQRYDPAFILRFSIHGLSMGYFELLEFAGLGLLALSIMSISSPDQGIRKLGYDALGLFTNTLYKKDEQNKKSLSPLRLLLLSLQNGIAQEMQRIPSVSAIFAAEASLVLLDPSSDHHVAISELLRRSPLNLKSIPLFDTLFESCSIKFKTDKLWILRLSYSGLNLDDDAEIFQSKCLHKMLSFYSSSLSDYESKILILQIVKKAVKLPTLARYLVKSCGLLSWLSSVFCFCDKRLYGDGKDQSVKAMTISLEVVNDIISQSTITKLLQNYHLEQLSELSSHLYKFIFENLLLIKQNAPLIHLILQIVVTTLRVTQKREMFEPHLNLADQPRFNLSYDSLFQLYQAIDGGHDKGFGLTADLVLKAILTSAPPILNRRDISKLTRFVRWAIPVASMPYSEEKLVLRDSELQSTTFFGEQQSKNTLLSTLLRWVAASVILGRISRTSCKIDTFALESREYTKEESLKSLLDNLRERHDKGIDDDFDEGREDDHSNIVGLAVTILYLQQLLGMNDKVIQPVVSALSLLLLPDDSKSAGGAFSLIGDQGRYLESLCADISCPAEANLAWRWSFDRPWEDSSSELTELQKLDEYNACETSLLIFSNAVGGRLVNLPVLSHQDLNDSGVFGWERKFFQQVNFSIKSNS
ncbi:hypothetical protein C5167_009331 [Papaver somniferum]|uniref:Nucleolar pre-ribosomal-associated protein 1 N-terminal domain-containing protein n=1 Tax=Papaver somniferum TaxID=3469 RepID=A0A4Y7K0Z3_PAPSO|nr:hypothetical protein C5167_009331 [Papaver somniferum]